MSFDKNEKRSYGNALRLLVGVIAILVFVFWLLLIRPGIGGIQAAHKMELADLNRRLDEIQAETAGLRAELEKHRALVVEAIESSGGGVERNEQGNVIAVDLSKGREVFENDMLLRALTFPELRTLRIGFCAVSPDLIHRIAALRHLEELYFRETPIDDAGLEAILTSIPRLKRLTLRRIPAITDAGIAPLAAAKELKALSCISLSLTGRSLDVLSTSKTLSSLDIRLCGDIAREDYEKLAGIARLTELKIGGGTIDDSVLETVGRLPNLTSLLVEDAQITPEGLLSLLHRQDFADRLRWFGLSRIRAIDDRALEGLRRCPRLRTVAMKEMPVSGDFLDRLVGDDGTPMPLETLSLNQTELIETAFPKIARFVTLKRLDLAGVLVNAEALKSLAGLPQLRSLNLASSYQTDVSLEPIALFPALESLDLSGNIYLSVASADTLRRIGTLKTLTVRGTALGSNKDEPFEE